MKTDEQKMIDSIKKESKAKRENGTLRSNQ